MTRSPAMQMLQQAEEALLRAIVENQGPINMSELFDKLSREYPESTLSLAASRLLKRGGMARTPDRKVAAPTAPKQLV